jgi:hypothetical protein
METFRKLVISVVFGALAALSCAGVSFVAHPGYPNPTHFSGTNSRAFYRATVTYPHNHISKFELLLNGNPTLVLDTPYIPGSGGGKSQARWVAWSPSKKGRSCSTLTTLLTAVEH